VVKELTPEELEKTENFAKACNNILSSERTARANDNAHLTFGIPPERRDASIPVYRCFC
jgi:hypothetical protein